MVELYDYQLEAIEQIHNGSILCGGVGSGKSRTALGYYLFKVCHGDVKVEGYTSIHNKYIKMIFPRDLYIITTAKKRDSMEWQKECLKFLLSDDNNTSHSGVRVIVDSWNNIKKYKDVYGAFFIFDEQRVVGSGAWVKIFLQLSKKNKWILLSATPGDTWSDYIPVFIANGFYKNRTEFKQKHCVYSPYVTKYPKIERYVGEKELRQYRDRILVHMDDKRKTKRIDHWIITNYDKDLYKQVFVGHWNPYDNEPIQECGKWYYLQRRVVNSDSSRIDELNKIIREKSNVIVFYNYNYELEILKSYLEDNSIKYKEWNGKRHQELPTGLQWVYLVQYSAGCEGWNCVSTDTIVFFSQNYSYRVMEQASGRIDRINTPFEKLHYYHFRSNSFVDKSIYSKIKNKKNFNEDAKLFEKYSNREKILSYNREENEILKGIGVY